MLLKLREIIKEYVIIEEDKITEDLKLAEDLGLNSYEFMSLIGEIEEEFNVEVEEKEVVKIKTVGEVIEYISKLQVL